MEEHLIPYFAAEKSEALLFMLVGVAALAVSVWLLVSGGVYQGMMYPLAAIAVIQLVVGSTVFFRTDAQVAELQSQYQADRPAFREQETPRMEVVVKNFRIYKAIEIALLVTGIALTFIFRNSNLGYAIGVGLIVQSSIMLVLDLFAERRADEYLRFVMGA